MTTFSTDSVPDVLIFVVGATGSGKTTFINSASGSSLAVGRGLKSCTSKIQSSNSFTVNGRKVVLIDTPGVDDTGRSEADIWASISVFLAELYESKRLLAGIIYLHRISDPRVGGTAKRNFDNFLKLCGEEALRNVVIVTTRWEEVSAATGEEREKELKSKDIFFKPALDKGSRLLRHYNTPESARAIVKAMLTNTPSPLRIQIELVNQRKLVSETSVGAQLDFHLQEKTAEREHELARLEQEKKEAKKKNNKTTLKEIQEEINALKAQAGRTRVDKDRLHGNLATVKRKVRQSKDSMLERQHTPSNDPLSRLFDMIGKFFNIFLGKSSAPGRSKAATQASLNANAPTNKTNHR